ncbi:MAG TPA: hypothetical protein VKV24_10060 [Casimicrobiaceae bacterium]|nr:hypothetical protein [Casimicrobiaceae bacterium]
MLRLRWWVHPPRHFELQRGLDTVLAKVRQAMLAESAEALHRRSRSKREPVRVTACSIVA